MSRDMTSCDVTSTDIEFPVQFSGEFDVTASGRGVTLDFIIPRDVKFLFFLISSYDMRICT